MKALDLTGQRFGRLVVIEKCGVSNFKTLWKCICDCGNATVGREDHLREQRKKSCGCFRREYHLTHGHSPKSGWSPTYRTWIAMKQRCYKQRNKKYPLYGGRGIQMCARWFQFENFLADMGERPIGKTIDRINGNFSYMPSNCRWATPKEQSANSRRWK